MMAASDKTSPRQFGWIEETTHTTRPESEGSGALSEGESVIKFVDKGTIDNVGWDDSPVHFAESHAAVSAEWRHVSPRPWSSDEKYDGRDTERSGQLTMFHPGEQLGPKITGLSSTKQGRFASARGVGIMANILERETGRSDISGSSNLSPQSAPMVAKLTGEEIQSRNSVGFDARPHFGRVLAPDSDAEVDVIGGDKTRTTSVRWLGDEETKAGGQRLKEHMKLRREPRTTIPMDALNAPELPPHQVAMAEPLSRTAAHHALRNQMEAVGTVPAPSAETRQIARNEQWHTPMPHEDVLASIVRNQMGKPGPHKDKPVGR